jgi:putative hemolysin
MLVFVLATASALVFSFLCSISEAVLLSVRHAHVEALGRSRAGSVLRRFKKEIDVPIAAILILNTVAHTAGASVAGAAYGDAFAPETLWIFTTLFTISVLIFTEILPKTLGVVAVGRLAAPVALGVSALVWVLSPAVAITRALSSLLRRGQEAPVTSLREIRLLAALGRSEGVVGKGEADMIEGAAQLRELRVRDVMVPRGGVVFLSGQRSLSDNLARVRHSGHSRFPYSPTSNLDDASGLLLAKDVLFALRDSGDAIDLSALASKGLVVPATTTLYRLMRLFQEERKHMAMAVDEYGGIEGVVTLEDVIEVIVGDIEDESDRVQALIVKRSDGTLVCRGWAEMWKIFAALDLEAPDEAFEATTVNGVVAELVGRIPSAGDRVETHDIEIMVVQASSRRAERLEVRRVTRGSTDVSAS